MTHALHTAPRTDVTLAGSHAAARPREDEDPLFYGSRWVRVETARGHRLEEVPLTREDLLDPQEGDCVTHSFRHGDTISEIKEMLRAFFASQSRDGVAVCDDVKMIWEDPEIPRVGPDIAVIPGMADPQRERKSFDEKAEGTRPVFVLEVVSESTEDVDYHTKPGVYRRAGVEEYLILDQLVTPWTLLGYRLSTATRRYRKIRPDARGRLRAETLGLDFSIAANGEDVVVEEVATGRRLLKPVEESAARRALEAENRRLLAEIEQLRRSAED